MTEFIHKSVLLHECLEGLNIKPDGVYVDGTLGGGGHSSEILKRLTTGRLIGIDRDMDAIRAARHKLNVAVRAFAVEQGLFDLPDAFSALALE